MNCTASCKDIVDWSYCILCKYMNYKSYVILEDKADGSLLFSYFSSLQLPVVVTLFLFMKKSFEAKHLSN